MAPTKKTGQSNLFGGASHEPARKPFTDEQKQELRNNWLVPANSAQERRLLRQWASQEGLSEKDRALIRAWIDKPDGFDKRNVGFWRAAKKSVLGHVVYAIAIERHKQLRPEEWLVACLTVQGVKQDEIADMLEKGERSVDAIVRSVKDKIVQDFGCDIKSVNLSQITRWFFGL